MRVCVRQCQSECLCIWTSGGGRAIICSKLLAGRGEVGETVIQKESKGWRERGEGEVRTSKEEMSWQEKRNADRKKNKKNKKRGREKQR